MCDLTLKGNCSIWRKKTTAHRWSHYDQKTCKGWESNRQDHKPIPLTITFSLTPGICWLTSSSGVSDTTLLHSNKYGEKYLIYLMELFQTKKKKLKVKWGLTRRVINLVTEADRFLHRHLCHLLFLSSPCGTSRGTSKYNLYKNDTNSTFSPCPR